MYKVIEVANLLNVSKVTVYKKLDLLKQDLKPFIHKKKNITYIDEAAIEIIRNSLAVVPETTISEEIEELKSENQALKDHLGRLEQELDDALVAYVKHLEQVEKKLRKASEQKSNLIDLLKRIFAENKERIATLEKYKNNGETQDVNEEVF